MEVRNTTDSERYWPDVQCADGSTLQLAPGETAVIDVDIAPSGLTAVKSKPAKPAKPE